MDFLSEWLQGINTWWLFAAAVAFILIDWMLARTEAFLALGLALLPIALLHALSFPALILLWCFPFCALFSFIIQRKIYLFSQKESPKPSFESSEGIVGLVGRLKIINCDNHSDGYFYQGLPLLANETKPKSVKICQLVLPNGETLPADFIGDDFLHDGAKVRVVSVTNGVPAVVSDK
jgi:hypothetical protein